VFSLISFFVVDDGAASLCWKTQKNNRLEADVGESVPCFVDEGDATVAHEKIKINKI